MPAPNADEGDEKRDAVDGLGPRHELDPVVADGVLASVRAGLFEAPPEPARLGKYVVLRRVGAGGMGLVYAAFDPELDRKVAVKILRYGESEAETQRLRREARSLARLSHPNVVAVHDLARSPSGLLLAMDFVDGPTLAQWLDEADQPVPRILDVFAMAGRGLAAAHGAGLVHRDFKPSNVLIGPDGVAKVADFGLARGFEGPDEAAEEAPQTQSSETITRAGTVLGTPGYMAPEQYRAVRATAQSDQFTFCVALHEALYGARPFEGKTHVAILDAIEAQRFAPATRRVFVPGRVRRAMLRGLRADPDERWPSMRALLSRLRPRRGRTGLVVLGVAGLGLGGLFVIVRPPAGPQCERGPSLLSDVWGEGARQTVRAGFIRGGGDRAQPAWPRVEVALDGYVDGWRAEHVGACEATHVRGEQSGEMLDRRMLCLRRRQRELTALLDLLTGALPEHVDRAVEAVSELRPASGCSAASLSAQQYEAPPALDAAAVDAVGATLAHVDALSGMGRFDEALALATTASDEAKELGYAPTTAEALMRLGRTLFRLARYDGAESATRQGLWLATGARHDGLAAEAAVHLTRIAIEASRFADAEGWAEHAAAATERLADDARRSYDLLAVQGEVHFTRRRHREALTAFEAALGLAEGQLGMGLQVALTRQGVANALHGMQRFSEASAAYEVSLAELEELLGPEHPVVARCLYNLGALLIHEGRDFEAARQRLERALAIREAALGDSHHHLARTHQALGAALAGLDRWGEAREHFERALAIAEREVGEQHTTYASALAAISNVLVAERRWAEARIYMERSMKIEEDLDGPDSPRLVPLLSSMAELAIRDKDWLGAIGYAERGLAVLAGTEEPYSRAQMLTYLGLASGVTDARKRSDESFAEAAELLSAPDAPTKAKRVLASYQGDVAEHRENTKDALRHHRRCFELHELPPADPMERALAGLRLLDALWMDGHRDEALTLAPRIANEYEALNFDTTELRAWRANPRGRRPPARVRPNP